MIFTVVAFRIFGLQFYLASPSIRFELHDKAGGKRKTEKRNMSSIGTGVNLLFFIFFKLFKNGICFCCIPLADNRKRIC